MKRPNDPKKFLSENELSRVTAKIAGAEKLTSAEIKLVILRRCWMGIRKKANKIFKKHDLDKTVGRNGVLILMVTTNREFLIYGDQGIDEKVGQDFWESIRDAMIEKFKENQFGEGLCLGVQLISEKLAPVFPHQEGDENELSNDVEFED